jgi:hypothetical protein
MVVLWCVGASAFQAAKLSTKKAAAANITALRPTAIRMRVSQSMANQMPSIK